MNNINDIWNIVADFSAILIKHDQITQKQQQIKNCRSHACGNCEHWMKSGCIPEKEHKKFKSISSQGCKLFQLSWSSEKIAKDLEKELQELIGNDK